MNRQLFGTDGMRGEAGQFPLDRKTVVQVGRAVGSLFARPDKFVLVGNDPRESSDELVQAVVDGLVAVGCKVKQVGVVPTPGLAYLTRTTDAAAGVMVTASHNLYTDNGIKVFKAGGHKLTDDDEIELNEAIMNGHFKERPGSSEEALELVKQYEDFLVDSAQGANLSGLKVALDNANGAAYEIAPRVFERLGAEVAALFSDPDGKNINYYCGATNTKALQDFIKEKKFDVGVAVDGDADRLIMVDGQGREFGGDYILYTLALQLHAQEIATTVMSNYGLEKSLAKHGVKLHRTKVGDRYVLDSLREHKLTLGGEQSGHIIIFDKQPTGDALLAAVELLAGVVRSGKKLEQWRDEAVMLPQAVVNIRVPNKSEIENEQIQELINAEADAIGEGRLLVRASGTEPKVRIMVEGKDARVKAEAVAEKLKAAMAKL